MKFKMLVTAVLATGMVIGFFAGITVSSDRYAAQAASAVPKAVQRELTKNRAQIRLLEKKITKIGNERVIALEKVVAKLRQDVDRNKLRDNARFKYLTKKQEEHTTRLQSIQTTIARWGRKIAKWSRLPLH